MTDFSANLGGMNLGRATDDRLPPHPILGTVRLQSSRSVGTGRSVRDGVVAHDFYACTFSPWRSIFARGKRKVLHAKPLLVGPPTVRTEHVSRNAEGAPVERLTSSSFLRGRRALDLIRRLIECHSLSRSVWAPKSISRIKCAIARIATPLLRTYPSARNCVGRPASDFPLATISPARQQKSVRFMIYAIMFSAKASYNFRQQLLTLAGRSHSRILKHRPHTRVATGPSTEAKHPRSPAPVLQMCHYFRPNTGELLSCQAQPKRAPHASTDKHQF